MSTFLLFYNIDLLSQSYVKPQIEFKLSLIYSDTSLYFKINNKSDKIIYLNTEVHNISSSCNAFGCEKSISMQLFGELHYFYSANGSQIISFTKCTPGQSVGLIIKLDSLGYRLKDSFDIVLTFHIIYSKEELMTLLTETSWDIEKKYKLEKSYRYKTEYYREEIYKHERRHYRRKKYNYKRYNREAYEIKFVTLLARVYRRNNECDLDTIKIRDVDFYQPAP
jgi:hypothetical protein